MPECMELMAYWSQNNKFKYLVVRARRYITWKFKIMNNKGKYNLFTMFVLTNCAYWVVCSAWRVSLSRKTHLCVSCRVLVCLFQVPLISCASSRRVGETRDGAFPKNCPYYVTELSAVLQVRTVIIPVLDIWFDSRFSQHRASSCNDLFPHKFNVFGH
jgi:hypothetical protein